MEVKEILDAISGKDTNEISSNKLKLAAAIKKLMDAPAPPAPLVALKTVLKLNQTGGLDLTQEVKSNTMPEGEDIVWTRVNAGHWRGAIPLAWGLTKENALISIKSTQIAQTAVICNVVANQQAVNNLELYYGYLDPAQANSTLMFVQDDDTLIDTFITIEKV
jgi:hypothetical protein